MGVSSGGLDRPGKSKRQVIKNRFVGFGIMAAVLLLGVPAVLLPGRGTPRVYSYERVG